MPRVVFYCDDDNDHRWGYRLDTGMVPLVDDTVELWHAEKDEESNDFIEAVVIKRIFDFDDETIYIFVELEVEMPEGHVADSPQWPSATYSRQRNDRERNIERALESATKGATDGQEKNS